MPWYYIPIHLIWRLVVLVQISIVNVELFLMRDICRLHLTLVRWSEDQMCLVWCFLQNIVTLTPKIQGITASYSTLANCNTGHIAKILVFNANILLLFTVLRTVTVMGMATGYPTRSDPWICDLTTTGWNPCTRVVKTRRTNTAGCVGTEPWATTLTPSLVNLVKHSSEGMPLKDW